MSNIVTTCTVPATVATSTVPATVATSTVPATVASIVSEATYGDLTGYRAADVKIKAAVRATIDKAIFERVGASDMIGAKIMLDAQALIKAAGSAPVAPVIDYVEVLAVRAATLKIAYEALLNGARPEGMGAVEIDQDALRARFTALDEAPSAEVLDEAAKIANTKITRSTAPRRDVGAHVSEVLARYEVGEFVTVREISQAITESYPEGTARPSDGAVAARLFPKGTDGKVKPTTIPNVEAVDSTSSTPKGARRTA